MDIPPSPPNGLDSHQYLKLALQYHLMGKFRQALKAGRMALESESEQFVGTPLEYINKEDLERIKKLISGIDDGVGFGSQLWGASKSVYDEVVDKISNTNEKADEIVSDKESLRIFKYALEETMKGIAKKAGFFAIKLAHSAVLATHPSREVPDGLNKEEYFRLGNRYLALYWPEQAKDAFYKVLELDPHGVDGEIARRLIDTRLPKEPTPYYAVKKFIEARRLSNLGQSKDANLVYQELMQDYPDFEWPIEQAAIYAIQSAEIDYAIDILKNLLKSNPSYVSAHEHLARAYAITGSILESQICLDKTSQLGYENEEVTNLRQVVSMLSRL